ncbi:hypothetical protein DFQ10_103119 [Winogradskyella eximia]|uniref:DUF6705 domain-containing protein n=1 Tax=Winogradskyella eximia TaxID=262006 RepID=A0A3D9H4J5_9FLAO|nr:DUF6705 family protein [Winogradskyella eximia]RED44435.1 hypothetical protein DFQ10_103119 [Winogradskyella eximia]
MKQILFTTLLLLISVSITAQTVIDMADESITNETKNGTYYVKDINNYMQPYLGTWKYINENEEFRIILTKVEMFHVILPEASIDYYKDGLKIQYQKYENNVLTYDSVIDSHPSGIIQEFGVLDITFTDYERNNEIFSLELTLISTGINEHNKLKFALDKFESSNSYHDEHPNEPYFSVPNNIEMTKM